MAFQCQHHLALRRWLLHRKLPNMKWRMVKMIVLMPKMVLSMSLSPKGPNLPTLLLLVQKGLKRKANSIAGHGKGHTAIVIPVPVR